MTQMTFEDYVMLWDRQRQLIANLVDDKKRMTTAIDAEIAKIAEVELTMRKTITDSLKVSLGAKLTEGVNNVPLENGRSLKMTNKIDRKVDEASISMSREEYAKTNDNDGVTFDQLLRVKYELNITEFRKIEKKPGAFMAASRMLVTTSPPQPPLELI